MSPAPQCRHCSDRMGVVRNGNHDSIDTRLIDETPKIIVSGRLRKAFLRFGQVGIVDVAQRNDVFLLQILEAEPGLACSANEANIQLVIR